MNDQDPRRVYLLKGFSNKKKLFETLAEELSRGEGPSFHRILDGLNAREKLGSTYIGKGVAIPHCKLTIDSPRVVLIKLKDRLKYAEQCVPDVDIVIGLLVPSETSEQHLHILASIAKLCDKDDWLDELRNLDSTEAIINHISATETKLEELL